MKLIDTGGAAAVFLRDVGVALPLVDIALESFIEVGDITAVGGDDPA